jgi:hypothetical protein
VQHRGAEIVDVDFAVHNAVQGGVESACEFHGVWRIKMQGSFWGLIRTAD